jgi:hypothetical protein
MAEVGLAGQWNSLQLHRWQAQNGYLVRVDQASGFAHVAKNAKKHSKKLREEGFKPF